MKAVEPQQPLHFIRPQTGLIEVTVNARSGLLPSGAAGEEIIEEIFLAGTDPKERDSLLAYESGRRAAIVDNLRRAIRLVDTGSPLALAPLDGSPPLVPEAGTTITRSGPTRNENPLLD